MEALDLLERTTFATRAAAEAILAKTGGDLQKARKELARRKSTPVDPKVGPWVLALLAAARARGNLPARNGGPLLLLHQELPPDFSALLFAGMHWLLEGVDLGGGKLWAPAMVSGDARHRAPTPRATAYRIGELASGADLVVQVFYDSPTARWVAFTEGGELAFEGLDALLQYMVEDAHRRGVTTALDSPPAKPGPVAPGPPRAEPGADHRVYAGASPVEASLFYTDLYRTMRVSFELRVKTKLPPNDLWLVSDKGQLYRLIMLSKSGRSVVCEVQPVGAQETKQGA